MRSSVSEEFAQIETSLNSDQMTATNIIALAVALQRVALGTTVDVRVVEHPFATFPVVLEHFESGNRVCVASLSTRDRNMS